MRRNPFLIWAGRVVALTMAILVLTGAIAAGGPLAWGMVLLAIALILLGGGGRRR